MKKVAARSARLGKRSIDAAEPTADRYTVWDTELKGFGLRVSPSGVKTFVVRYRVGGGRTGTLRQQLVGRYGVLTPDKARDQAKLILASATKGEDPQGKRADGRSEMTIAALCDLYMVEGVDTKKASTLYVDKGRIARHIKPILGKMKVSAVTQADVSRLLRDIASGKVRDSKFPHVTGGKHAATRAVALLSGIFTFAVGRGLCAANPCRGLKTFPSVKRERFLSRDEWTALGEALASAQGAGVEKAAVDIIRLLAMTGCRKSEISGLRWSEIDEERGLLILEDSKTGKKVVPIGAPAMAILAEQPRGSVYAFPDPRNNAKPFHAVHHRWLAIRKAAALEGVRLHDLRHSYASTGLAGGYGLPMIGKLLGHSQVSTTARYSHLADDPLRQAAERISSTISGAMSGKTAEIKPLKKGAQNGQ